MKIKIFKEKERGGMTMSVCGQCKRSLDNKNPDEIIHECDCCSKTLCEDCTVEIDNTLLCPDCANKDDNDKDNLKCTGCGNYIKSCTCNCCTHTSPKRKFIIGGKIYWLCSKCEDEGEE